MHQKKQICWCWFKIACKCSASWLRHASYLFVSAHNGGFPAREFGMMITNLVLIYGGGDGSGDGVRKKYDGCCQSWSWDSSCHFTSTCHSENMANGMKKIQNNSLEIYFSLFKGGTVSFWALPVWGGRGVKTFARMVWGIFMKSPASGRGGGGSKAIWTMSNRWGNNFKGTSRLSILLVLVFYHNKHHVSSDIM